MADRVSLTEKDLPGLVQCSLYKPLNTDLMGETASAAFRWAVHQRHFVKIPTPELLRARFVKEWVQRWSGERTGQAYWEGPNAARKFGVRVYEFLLKFEVFQPFVPYQLDFEHGSIKGEHAIVVWSRGRANELHLSLNGPLSRPSDIRVPKAQDLARWLAGRQVADTVDFGMLNQTLVRGDRWIDRELNEPLARRWLSAVVSQSAQDLLFPRYGMHCTSCSHPCTEVYQWTG